MAYSTQFVIILVLSFGFCKSENCDKYGVLIYEDIGCKPVNVAGKECPSKFVCDFSQPKSGCLFKGRAYGYNEDISSNLTFPSCNTGCFCDDSGNITCAIFDCPENFGPTPKPGCYNGYELGECCSTRKICNATETKTCKVDGRSYDIGEQFYPKNTCLTCVCHENFTGEYDEKTCSRQSCGAQLDFGSAISQNCAAAYFTYNTYEVYCCPQHFICPDPSDKIKLVNPNAVQDSGLECSYGEKKLKLGEGFGRKVFFLGEDRDVQCECILPPLLTCKEL